MKTVLITGVSRGAGQALAKQFLDEGWQVIGTSTSGTVSLEHASLTVHKLDLAQQAQVASFVEELKAAKVKLDVLINNAGVNLSSEAEYPTKTLSVDTLEQTLAVNLVGLAALTEACLPLMQSDGQIIALSSGAGAFHPFIAANTPSYQISKAAVNMYMRTLAERLKDEDIKAWLFDPGWMKTDMGGPYGQKMPEQAAAELYGLVAQDKPTNGTFWTADGERDF